MKRFVMQRLHLFHIVLILALTIIMFSLTPVFATSMADDPWTTTVKNYAKFTVVANCNDAGNGGDSDNDGICNAWESGSPTGLHINFTDTSTNTRYAYNLSCVAGRTIIDDPTGATVCPTTGKKDIYVELDWMKGHQPSSTAIADVVNAFDKMNIALHVVGGEDATTQSGNMTVHYCYVHPAKATNTLSPITTNDCTFSGSTVPSQSLALIKRNFFGTIQERNGDATFCPRDDVPSDAGTVLNNASYNCLTAKRQVFHYIVVGNKLAITSGTGVDSVATAQSGWAELPGNDILITLGSFTNGVGNIDAQEATMMHELGHNLGLHHGGDINPTGTTESDQNCKPNYMSVMSYTYQFRSTFDICRPLSYSSIKLQNLTETSLNDSNIDPTHMATYPGDNPNPPDNPNKSPHCDTGGERRIKWSSPAGIQTNTAGITEDWNMNGISAALYPKQNINNLGITGCNTSTNSTLNTFNDTNYIYHGGSSAANPLVFRTSAYSNFAASTVSTGDNADIGGGEQTSNEEGPDQVPSIPTDLVAIVVSSSGVDLSWSAPSNDGSPITGYKIERNSGSGFVTIMANTGSQMTTYHDDDLSPDTYTYQISAINSIGISDPSNPTTVVIGDGGDKGQQLAMVIGGVTTGVIIAVAMVVAKKGRK